MIELWQNKVSTVFISSHVQWLKKADEASYYPPTAFDFEGQIFTVLKSGQLEEGPWDLYSSPLVLESVTEADEGLYDCLAANRFGFSRLFAYVYYIPVSTTPTP